MLEFFARPVLEMALGILMLWGYENFSPGRMVVILLAALVLTAILTLIATAVAVKNNQTKINADCRLVEFLARNRNIKKALIVGWTGMPVAWLMIMGVGYNIYNDCDSYSGLFFSLCYNKEPVIGFGVMLALLFIVTGIEWRKAKRLKSEINKRRMFYGDI